MAYDACFGMVGCLVFVVFTNQKASWATSLGDLASFHLDRCLGAYPVDFGGAWTPPDHWDADDIALEMPEYPNMSGLMVAGRISLLLGGFEVAGAGVYLPASETCF